MTREVIVVNCSRLTTKYSHTKSGTQRDPQNGMQQGGRIHEDGKVTRSPGSADITPRSPGGTRVPPKTARKKLHTEGMEGEHLGNGEKNLTVQQYSGCADVRLDLKAEPELTRGVFMSTKLSISFNVSEIACMNESSARVSVLDKLRSRPLSDKIIVFFTHRNITIQPLRFLKKIP